MPIKNTSQDQPRLINVESNMVDYNFFIFLFSFDGKLELLIVKCRQSDIFSYLTSLYDKYYIKIS